MSKPKVTGRKPAVWVVERQAVSGIWYPFYVETNHREARYDLTILRQITTRPGRIARYMRQQS